MTSSPRRLARALAVVAVGSAAAVLGAALPAAAAPAPVSGLGASLAAHGLLLTWTNPAAGAPVVRDVTGETAPYDPAGTAVTGTTATCPASTCRYDAAFTNTTSRTYAVWSTDDGTAATAAPAPELVTVDPLPAVATAATLSASVPKVVYPHAVVLTGSLTRAGAPLPGSSVKLVSTVLGGATAVLATLTTRADGTVQYSYVPSRSRAYRLVYDGDAFSASSASAVRTVALAPRVTAAFSSGVVEWKTPSVLSGSVAPGLAGKAVAVQRWTGATWATVATPVLSSTSTYRVSQDLSLGKYYYRTVLYAAVDRSTGISPTVTLTVTPRTLVQGDSGPDVLALERKLAAQHYDVGRVDSYFSYDTRHGVTAFQKVERLARTGQWGATERTRVLSPHGIRMRYRDSRLTAEVDITRQVLVLGRYGVIQKIVDVSTGSEKYYYQDGVRYVAHTPRGVFRVYRKIDGIRISKLGELYRPSYFYQGWAIHGSGSVPTYPASHGCVRITNPVADRLFALLVIGTRVAVYDE
jgi:hypothetical protein